MDISQPAALIQRYLAGLLNPLILMLFLLDLSVTFLLRHIVLLLCKN